jgi:hypothetical protein
MSIEDNIYSILGLNSNSFKLIGSSNTIINTSTKNELQKHKNILDKIIHKLQNIDSKPYQYDSKMVSSYKSFLLNAKYGNDTLSEIFNSRKKAKKLAWMLGYKENNQPRIVETEFFGLSLNIINLYWSNSMILSLLDLLLQNWNSENKNNINILKKILLEKISAYSGKRKFFNNLKENKSYFFSENGDYLLGNDLLKKNIKISESIKYLSLPDYMRFYDFFSETVVSYTENIINSNLLEKNLSEIVSFLQKHQNINTSKKCLSKIILSVNDVRNESLKEDIKTNSFNLIGDPSNDSYWKPWKNANEKEIQELKESQNLLNNWITEKFIEIFFENLAMDKNRKEFWRNYLKNISRFKIYSTFEFENILKKDPRISPYLKSRLGVLGNGYTKVSAMVMVIKNYLLVEFSNTGNAFFAYKLSNSACPDINEQFQTINNLKNQHLRDFKLSHSGDWEYTLSNWLEQRLGVKKDKWLD